MKQGVWAALCTGIADGAMDQYTPGAKHAIIAMVSARESEAEGGIRTLLSDNGWSSPQITNLKLLEDPLKSDDADMMACYRGAIEKDGGIIVYSDPIREQQAER